jgi:hypothetical protein
MILNRLDHYRMLSLDRGDLHATGATDRRVGDVAVAGNLIGGVDDDHAASFGGEPGRLAQDGRLPDTGSAEEENGAARTNLIGDDLSGTRDRPPDATGEANDHAGAISDGANPVQGATNPGPVVAAEATDAALHGGEVVAGDLPGEQVTITGIDPREWRPPKVKDNLSEAAPLAVQAADRAGNVFRE